MISDGGVWSQVRVSGETWSADHMMGHWYDQVAWSGHSSSASCFFRYCSVRMMSMSRFFNSDWLQWLWAGSRLQCWDAPLRIILTWWRNSQDCSASAVTRRGRRKCAASRGRWWWSLTDTTPAATWWMFIWQRSWLPQHHSVSCPHQWAPTVWRTPVTVAESTWSRHQRWDWTWSWVCHLQQQLRLTSQSKDRNARWHIHTLWCYISKQWSDDQPTGEH